MALLHFSSLCLLSFHKSLDCSSARLPSISRRELVIERKSRRSGRCRATVATEDVGREEVLVPAEAEVEEAVAEYDWREEWYPLYLTEQIPDDAPLGLSVFDKQLVLFRDGDGVLRCFEDRCPHRLAKLSEGQLVDGRLECLYHGWQFAGEGRCVKIPQLPESAKIPRAACVRSYEVRDSQGVVWVWMSDKTPQVNLKLPWFEHYDRPGFQAISSVHELPYDHSILLENLMDPAHVPISHDRTDWTARREEAQPLEFEVTERTARGFAGRWGRPRTRPGQWSFLRFQAPCVLSNDLELIDTKGEKQYLSALFLCRPTGQGKSMLIARFGSSSRPGFFKLIPDWFIHQNQCSVFEQDMGFLSSQNEVLVKERRPTRDLYLSLRSSDTWVAEYRKWMDRAGHGMPYHFGHATISLPKEPAVVEQAPVGVVAGISATFPAKGGVGERHAPNPANRYYRHVVHCKQCRKDLKAFRGWNRALLAAAAVAVGAAILAAGLRVKVLLLAAAALFVAGSLACSAAIDLITTNFIRSHRKL